MYICDECGKSLHSEGGLGIHMEMAHAPEPPEPEPQPVVDEQVEAAMHRLAPRVAAVADAARPDPTVRVAVVLVITLLLAGVATAILRPTPDALVTIASSAPPLPTASGAARVGLSAGDCSAAIGAMSTRPSARRADVTQLVRSGGLGPMPLPGHERPVVSNVERFTDVDDYMASVTVVDAERWRAAMVAGGFRQSDHADYAVGRNLFVAGAYRFESPEGAIEFQQRTLQSVCDAGLMASALALDGLSGGLAFVDLRGGVPPFAATFVAGDTVVRLRICECVEAPDDLALATQWARVTADQVGGVSS